MNNHRFHGDKTRFRIVANFVYETFGRNIKYIADVAGGQGMLTRILRNKYNYDAEVVDPRGWRMVGVPGREEDYISSMADYYDLVIGLHPDEATKDVAESSKYTSTLLIPCCNFWDRTKVLGTDELLNEIRKYYDKNGIKYQEIIFKFKPPKNVGLLVIKNKKL